MDLTQKHIVVSMCFVSYRLYAHYFFPLSLGEWSLESSLTFLKSIRSSEQCLSQICGRTSDGISLHIPNILLNPVPVRNQER